MGPVLQLFIINRLEKQLAHIEYVQANKLKVDDDDIADEYPDIDDMALREALRRFTEFWKIDWNESNFLDWNGEEWNI